MSLRVLDLFSGIGGFSLGLERTGGFETVVFCEIDARAQAVLRKQWPRVPIINDVETAHFRKGMADVITAGFPCQDISLAGPGAGLAGARSSLFWSVMRAIRVVRPLVVLLENVEALLRRGMGDVLGALASEGYDAEWDCVRAIDAGRPHLRKRIYIAAYAQSHGRGPGRPGGLADGIAWLPIEPCWNGNPIDFFEERLAQPALLGMDDEFPRGLDRLSLCGNALIPVIPELIGRAYLDAERLAA
jgi:DNA (cytosine-5)-methyltransferase 1